MKEEENLADKLKQKGDTCALVSTLFSLSNRYSIEDILNDIKKLPYDIVQIIDYLVAEGYEVDKFKPSAEHLAENIENNPLIILRFDYNSWKEFYGKATLTKWYLEHTICGVKINKNKLTYFEPLAGEIRTIDLDYFNNKVGEVIVIKK